MSIGTKTLIGIVIGAVIGFSPLRNTKLAKLLIFMTGG